jgi:hypothetical protein
MFRRMMAAAGLGMALVTVTTATVAAGGGLKWSYPRTVTSGTPVHVASVDPCPPVPTPGDTALVQVFLSFGSAGGSGQIVSVNPDGSWAGDITFNFSGVGRSGQISAACLDYTGFSATAYADYSAHHVKLVF